MKKISTIVLSMSIAIGLGAGWFLIKPIVGEINNFKSDIKLSESMKTTINAKKSILDSQQNILKEANTDKIKEIFPKDPGVPDLLVQVQNIAYKSGASLRNISFNVNDDSANKSLLTAKTSTLRGEAVNGLPTVDISASVIGIYSSIKSFLSLIENNVRIMDISSINLSVPQSDNAIEISADLSISAYFKPSQMVRAQISSE